MFHCEKIFRDFSSSDSIGEWKVWDNERKYLCNRYFHNFDSSREDHLHVLFQESLEFYANGNCEENKGYVSIIFDNMFFIASMELGDLKEVEVRSFFSVVDISGKKRFTQSIVQILDKSLAPENSRGNFDFGLERYLKRETLLNDPAELLPGDCLTISVEINYINHSPFQNSFFELFPILDQHNIRQVDYITMYPNHRSRVDFFFVDKIGNLCIRLDTFYGKKLCSLSGFFQRASKTPLIKARTRQVHIPVEEVSAFTNILNILFKEFSEVYLDSIDDICQLFVIADKYDFQSVIETCRQFLKAFFCAIDDILIRQHVTQSLPDIMELANKYGDSDLKDTLKTYKEGEDIFGANDYFLQKYLKERLFTDWKCVCRDIKKNDDYIDIFVLSRIAIPETNIYQ